MNRYEILHFPSWRIKKHPIEGGSENKIVLKKNWADFHSKGHVFEEGSCIAFYQARRLVSEMNLRQFDDTGTADFKDIFICLDLCDELGRRLSDAGLEDFKDVYKNGFFVENQKDDSRNHFVCFEASGSMTRTGRLMFVNNVFKDSLTEAITLLNKDEQPEECFVSKWLSYKGLCLSTGIPASGLCTGKNEVQEYIGSDLIDRVIVVGDCKEDADNEAMCITSDPGDDECKRIVRCGKQNTNWFDGAGLISPEYMNKIRSLKDGDGKYVFADREFTSVQFRMPFCKGMLHEVDFKRFFKDECGISADDDVIVDLWGKCHKLDDVDIILTESQFKANAWFKDLLDMPQFEKPSSDWTAWDEYRKRFKKHHHRLFITGQNKTDVDRGRATLLNYQILSTLSLDDDDVNKLVSEGFEPYRQLKTEDTARLLNFINPRERDVFDDSGYIQTTQKGGSGAHESIGAGLYKNARLIRETQAKLILSNACEGIRKNSAVGQLYVSGKVRYLCPDLIRMMYYIAGHTMDDSLRGDKSEKNWAYDRGTLRGGRFFAPGIKSSTDGNNTYSLTRNPHVAINEHVTANVYAPEGSKMDKYLNHLDGVCMINPRDFFAERLGGADFDGDMVRISGNPILVKAAKKGMEKPWIKISSPNTDPIANNADTQWDTVKKSMNSRVGEFSNYAYRLSAMAYGYHGVEADDNNSEKGEKKSAELLESKAREEKCAELLERMVMFIGREIDRVKTGAIVADVPKLVGYRDELSNLENEKDFLTKKDYYKKRKGPKPKDSQAKHFLNKLEKRFEELRRGVAGKQPETVPLADLIKDGRNAGSMEIDDDKVKNLFALLLAFDGIKKAVKYGFAHKIEVEYEDPDSDTDDDIDYVGETGAIDADDHESDYASEDDDEDGRRYHYLDRILHILTEQGDSDPQVTVDGITKVFANADSRELVVQMTELKTKNIWALTEKDKRQERLESVFIRCGIGKDKARQQHVSDVFCDFSLGGYNLLSYFLRYAKWLKLSRDICTQLTADGIKKALDDAMYTKEKLTEAGADADEIKKFTNIITALKQKQKLISFFGDDTAKYGEYAKKYFVDLRNAYSGGKSINQHTTEIAAKIFEGNPAEIVYAAMSDKIAGSVYDKSHAFFWTVAGKAVLEHDLLVGYNEADCYSLPLIKKEADGFDAGKQKMYRYLYKDYVADKREIV